MLKLKFSVDFSALDDRPARTIMPLDSVRADRRSPAGPRPTTTRVRPRRTVRSLFDAPTDHQHPTRRRHRPSPRSDPPLLPPRPAPYSESLARALATGTRPPRLSALGGSPVADRPARGLIVLLKNFL